MGAKDRTGIKWNRDETLLALDLYCRTTFSKISQKNPEIIKLARLLGRSPGSVALKMQNLAHFDPELQKRNISAMSHASKLDAEMFEEFSNNWEDFSYQAQKIRARLEHQDLSEMIAMEDMPSGSTREQEIKARIGQDFFRMAVLNEYGNRCCITGINCTNLLVASHIRPWKDSDAKAKTNPHNGLCLNSLHDKAFDQGLITLDKNYNIILSEKIKAAKMDSRTRAWFTSYENCQITLPDKFLPGKEFIEYHNDVVFQR